MKNAKAYLASRVLACAIAALASAASLAQVVTNPSATGISTASVTTVACTPSQGVTCTVANPTTAPALSVGLGDITPTSLTTATIGGTPTITLTNASGTAAALTAGTVTTNANLTGPITSTGNATAVAAQTGTGSTFVMQLSPTLTTPVLGAATATSINGNTITAGTGTLTLGSKTLSASNTLTLAGTDGTTVTFPTQSATVAPYLGSFAYASIPSCTASYSGYSALATDLGPSPGMFVTCDGTSAWVPRGEQMLARGAVPLILAPSGSMGNNGALTLGTALITAYPSSYMHLVANAISTGSSAGFYYTTCSTTTACTVFNNTYASGIPTIPTSPTAFSTTGPGAYTASTARVTMLSITLPGNLLAKNGSIEAESAWSVSNNADNKTLFVSFGGTDFLSNTQTTTNTFHDVRTITNRGSASVQVGSGGSGAGSGGWGAFGSTIIIGQVNTASDVAVTYAGQKGTATDYLVLEMGRMKVAP